LFSKRARPCIPLILISSLLWAVPQCDAQQRKKLFTVPDEIGLTQFGDPYAGGGAESLRFSPNGIYFAVYTERASLELNQVEDSLRFYRSEDIEEFLKRSDVSQPPSPVWVVNHSGREGPIVRNWDWLPDSSGAVFLERTGGGNQRLVLVDLATRSVEALTSATETVRAFNVRDRQHYVYTVANLASEREKRETDAQSPAIVGTGRNLNQLLLPDDPITALYLSHRSYDLWAVVGGKRFEVKRNGAPLVPEGGLGLSPDGGSLVTLLKAPEVPASWETLYTPPYASVPHNLIHAGRQDVRQYVLVDLQTGAVRALTDAPVSDDAGWFVYGAEPSWSSDGQEILLPGTFLKRKENGPSRPCIAVVGLPSLTCTCVETLKGHTENGGHEEGYHGIHSARFAAGDKRRITVTFHNGGDFFSLGTSEYRRSADGAWQMVRQSQGEQKAGPAGLEVTVEQGFDKPPLLIGTDKRASRVIWDPNPQLNDIELGQASTYKWKDKEGREWKVGLYKPSNYKKGQRYPLVIQTHGFTETEFRPSGAFPTAFAARALAAVGMVVLQIEDPCPGPTLEEGACVVSGYEAAANQLVLDGLVDPEKIGIIGFSRTCFYVMESLTFGSLRIKAASITDGVMFTYFQSMLQPERLLSEGNIIIGEPPFGKGLEQWLKRSPGFNLDKINAPLLVVAEGPTSLLYMWEPYAGLHYLKRPVDLVMLNTDEHILTNPSVRLASQGGSVDWFRFWLQEYEDPDSAKVEQYARWRNLRRLQEENEKRK
jgi:dipeptidyl aminopeptidase/acylaminoacyl peptidase